MTHFHSLLAGVANTTRAAIEAAAKPREYDKGEDLLHTGEPVPHVFHLRRGRARIWRPLVDGQSVTLAYVSRNAVPGIVPCCLDQNSTSTVTASTTLAADLWPAVLVRRLSGEDAIFARNALAMVSMYSLLLSDKVEDSVGSVPRRIGRALLRLSADHGQWDDDDNAAIKISRQELADLTGTTLFSVSRTLSDWQRKGMVSSAREQVTLIDPAAVAKVAELAE